MSQNCKRILIVSNKLAQLWDADICKPTGTQLQVESDIDNSYISPDGSRVVLTSYKSNAAILWDTKLDKQLLLHHEAPVNSVHFSRDGEHLLTGSADKSARLWNAISAKQEGPAMMHDHFVFSVSFSSDDKYILTVSGDRQMQILKAQAWDAKSCTAVSEPFPKQNIARNIIFTADGTRAMVGSVDGSAQLWNSRTGLPLGKPMTLSGGVKNIAVSPDGSLAATRDFTIVQVWDAVTGEPLGPAIGPEDVLLGPMKFSSDGRRILAMKSGQLIICKIMYPPVPRNAADIWSLKLGQKLSEDKLIPLTLKEEKCFEDSIYTNNTYTEELKIYYLQQAISYSEKQAKNSEDKQSWTSAVMHLKNICKNKACGDAYASRLNKAQYQLAEYNKEHIEKIPEFLSVQRKAFVDHQERVLREEKAANEPPNLAKARFEAKKDILNAMADKECRQIGWDKAAAELFKIVKVSGRVKSTYLGNKGRLIILNFGDKRTTEFCVVVPVELLELQHQKDALAFSEDNYVGRNIVVTGLVEMYRPTNTPQITIDVMKQIEIQEKDNDN